MINNNIKRQFESLDAKFKNIYEKVMQQFILTGELLSGGVQPLIIASVEQNKRDINQLESEIRQDVVDVILLTPRASELRKLIVYQDITNFLGTIADLLFNISVRSFQKIALHLPDFEFFKTALDKMLSFGKKMVCNAIFSFLYQDASIAYQTIREVAEMKPQLDELSENILLHFQDLPMSEQEVSNIIRIHTVACVFDQIGRRAVHIAEASVYSIEGKDIRHTLH